jgi:hypothetical protein
VTRIERGVENFVSATMAFLHDYRLVRLIDEYRTPSFPSKRRDML